MKYLVIGLALLAVIPPAQAIVISEVLYDATGSDTGQEFIELYNPAPQDVNVTGWVVERGNGGVEGDWLLEATLDGSIPAWGFLLIGESDVVGADITTTLDLQNGPDAVRVRADQVIDLVGYGEGFAGGEFYEGSPALDVPEGHSLERRPGYTDPGAGNGEDTGNNSADFLDNPSPDPQNRSVTEVPLALVDVIRTVDPDQSSYLPNTTVTVTLAYAFDVDQVGFLLREEVPGIENPAPGPQYDESGITKWLFTDQEAVPQGAVSYQLTLMNDTLLTGHWRSVDANTTLLSGQVADLVLEVTAAELSGKVEDVFGAGIGNATVRMDDDETATQEDGSYVLPVDDLGVVDLSASREGYGTRNVTVDLQDLDPLVFDFVANYSLIPLAVSDEEMLRVVPRWATGMIDGTTLLEVVYQWANTSS